MIEFKGHVTGSSEKFFFKRVRKLGIYIMLIACSVILLPIILYTLLAGYTRITIGGLAAFALIMAASFIPKSKKEKLSLTPKRIYTDGESIIAVGENYVESKYIGEEKKVIDHGEFYELVYPFGKISDKFICQKSLLTQGTLEKFESLFKGKIVRK